MSADPDSPYARGWLDTQQDFQQAKQEYQVYAEAYTSASQSEETKRLESLPLEELVQKLDEQLPFDLVLGITDFLQSLGAFGRADSSDEAAGTENDEHPELKEEEIINASDLDLLASILPTPLAQKLGRSPPTADLLQESSNIKASLLNTLARLALAPALTIPLAKSFRRIFVDLASRWLLMLGFNGHNFDEAQLHVGTYTLVVTALARTISEFPQLYPMLILVLHHPLLQKGSLSELLSTPDTFLSPDTCHSSALSPISKPPFCIYHPELPQILLAIYALVRNVPQLPRLSILLQTLGGPSPPSPVGDVLSSHPQLSMRTLAWHISSRWLGWTGPNKEALRRHYVYDPARDLSNGKDGTLKTDIPFLDSKDAAKSEYWLAYWPRVATKASCRTRVGEGLSTTLDKPLIDCWNFEESAASLATREWLLESATTSNAADATEHDMDTDDNTRFNPLLFTRLNESPLMANIAGVQLLKEAYLPIVDYITNSGSTPPRTPADITLPSGDCYVETVGCTSALRQLAAHVSARLPVLLSSPPSAGKAATLRELHRLLYTLAGSTSKPKHGIVTINLADKSLDAKNLLGTLTSSPTEPGTFIFAEGSLTRALKYGRWVVLDDVDKASDEVLSTVSELVERMKTRSQRYIGGGWGGGSHDSIGVSAGGHWVEAAPGFMLFATRSVPNTAAQDSIPQIPSFFGAQYWSQIWMDAPSQEEVHSIVEERFPGLASGIASTVVQTWTAICEASNSLYSTSSTGLSRSVGIRDLVKWCHRIEQAIPTDLKVTSLSQNPRLQDEVFLEAKDIFLNSFSSRTTLYANILQALEEGLGLSPERIDWALHHRVPEICTPGHPAAASLQYGRITLGKGKQSLGAEVDKRPYAFTKPFLVLLEELAACVRSHEPILLVGETGTGKTTAVAQLADMLGFRLTALNLSNQTEASDLLGGFRPINEAEELARLALRLFNGFSDLFATTFEMTRNIDFTIAVQKAFKKKRWPKLVTMFREAYRLACEKAERQRATSTSAEEGPRKKRKTAPHDLEAAWSVFLQEVTLFDEMVREADSKSSKFKFAFVEGPLVKALRNGDWVLLDEVNLATSETLESLSTLLQDSASSLVLTERGDLEPVKRHPDFRLFACMNPANDVGKRDLPPPLRTKFTEIFMAAPDTDKDVLLGIVQGYIGHVAIGDRGLLMDIVDLYTRLKTLAVAGKIADGTNHPPHFSMRTLARSLVFTSDFAQDLGARRAAYEGIAMCFTTSLDSPSKTIVRAAMQDAIIDRSKSPRSFFKTSIPAPPQARNFVSVGAYWLATGELQPQGVDDYVLTPSVEEKLVNLTRAVAAHRFPILLQGPTSSGKTSIIEYLAKRSGHQFVRINNHEHTDIQEYLGTYMSDPDSGKLVFQEGLLVKAVREGHWIVLDELNLAPTDVLEALNRLLDDNRELVIPETQEVVKPHPHFMLFATQNPPGLYGGRKILSRAFKNRFLEMQFSDVPQDELETILCQRCKIAPSYAKKIVAVFVELQRRRQSTRLFEEKHAFVTLRDLFRWGSRDAVGYEQLALDGYMLLAERTRSVDDKNTVRAVIEQTMKVSLDISAAYRRIFEQEREGLESHVGHLVWTEAMMRLYILIRTALSYNEPVLLVGETGSGKTSVCQAIAESLGRKLHIVNCHQNTETSDLIGSQRPLRNRGALQESLRLEAIVELERMGMLVSPTLDFEAALSQLQKIPSSSATEELDTLSKRMREALSLFVWHDGPLVHAMKQGEMLLLDEISLADDSVLERLNSVLEPARILTVAEKGSKSSEELVVQAHPAFEIVGTMNPGGDFGKKELSPALRNRFTEIWVPWLSDEEDILGILDGKLAARYSQVTARKMLSFTRWFTEKVRPRETYSFGAVVTLRDLLAWADFLLSYTSNFREAFVHGALMTLVDALGSTASSVGFSKATIALIRIEAVNVLAQLVDHDIVDGITVEETAQQEEWFGDAVFEHFLTRLTGEHAGMQKDWQFSFSAPTVRINALRVLRALQLPKPILLEGSPGVGKTSLVTALARIARRTLCRINLSDQTDLVDLFGSDAPVEGGRPGEFAWRDASFLTAMQRGDWVLLDEMNLASQSVLEGLNSCLDHRGSVYIPELDRTFAKHPQFRMFAAQNPTNQGGSRKGLPRSFVDRFTQVYMDDLGPLDYLKICQQLFPELGDVLIRNMVDFVAQLNAAITSRGRQFQNGAPWELNLRDLLRWMSLLKIQTGYERHPFQPVEFLDALFVQRFRDIPDRQQVLAIYRGIFGHGDTVERSGKPSLVATSVRIGRSVFSRGDPMHTPPTEVQLPLTESQLRPLQAMSIALESRHLVILTGTSGSGKTRLIETYANLTGQKIRSFSASSQTDTLEMLGSFQQCSRQRKQAEQVENLHALLDRTAAATNNVDQWSIVNRIAKQLFNLRAGDKPSDADNFASKIEEVQHEADGTKLEQAVSNFTAIYMQTLQAGSEAGRFEWLDGLLVQAMVQGEILVIENANRCNPAVLDRLNGLFEFDGTLFLTERGLNQDGSAPEIKPHPAFRVIMTVDPHAGELSRAMRNRGIEISLIQDLPPLRSVRSVTRPILNATRTQVLRSSHCSNYVDSDQSLDESEYDQPTLLHKLGRGQITSINAFTHNLHRTGLLEVLRSWVQLPIWRQLAKVRPGSVEDSPTGQMHQVSISNLTRPYKIADFDRKVVMFGLDTNEAWKDRAPAEIETQFGWDSIAESLLRILSTQIRIARQLPNSVSKPLDSVTVLEQSYLANVHPGRMPLVAKGVQSVHILEDALLATGLSVSIGVEAAPQEAATILESIANYSEELYSIANTRNLNYTVYQALLAAIKTSFSSQMASLQWRHLESAVIMAEDAVRRSSGQQLEVIWKHFQAQTPKLITRMASPGKLLKARAAELPMDLINLFLEIARSTEQGGFVPNPALLEALAQKIGKCQEISSPKRQPLDANVLLAASELETVARLLQESHAPTSFVSVATLIGDRCLSALLPTAIFAGHASHAAILCEWISNLTRPHTSKGNLPAIGALLTSCQLNSAFDNAHQSISGPLRTLDTAAEAISIVGKAHFEIVAVVQSSRTQNVCLNALGMVYEILGTLHNPAPRSELSNPSSIIAASLSILSTLDGPNGVPSLISALQHLDTALSQRAQVLECTSKLYVAFSLFFWDLYVPDIPLDPTMAMYAANSLLERQRKRLVATAAVEAKAAEEPGSRGTRRLDMLAERLDALKRSLTEVCAAPLRQEDRDQHMLVGLFAELRSCGNLLLHSEALKSCIDHHSRISRAQLENLQSSLLFIMGRLDTLYVLYADLVAPLAFGVGACIIGLGIQMHVSYISENERVASTLTKAAENLVKRPSASHLDELARTKFPIQEAGHGPAASPAATSLITLRAIAERQATTQQRLDDIDVDVIYSAYQELFALWTLDHKRAEEARAQSESIYRSRRQDHIDATDAEEEEREMLSLFPTFDDIDDGSENSSRLSGFPQDRSRTLLTVSDLFAVYEVHETLFALKRTRSYRRTLQAAKQALLADIFERHADLISETVDLHASQASLDILARAAKGFSAEGAAKPDFYHDSNTAQAAVYETILRKALARVNELVTAWPEQMILVELSERIVSLLDVPSSSPVSRMLTSIEPLLFKIADWESYASRETSLRQVTDDLTALVVQWRRLELQSWAGLLDSQERAFVEPLSEWWFRLFDICVRGPAGLDEASVDEAASSNTYLESLINLVRTFIETSPVGHFGYRLSLVNSFACMTSRLHHVLAIYERIANVLHNLHQYYSAWARRVESYVKDEKKRIEQEVHEVIRLASWKDVNIHALKASAQKSHRQLYKRVRALRKVLETPASRFSEDTVLESKGFVSTEQQDRILLQEVTLDPEQDRQLPSAKYHTADISTVLDNAERFLKRLQGLVTVQSQRLSADSPAQYLLGLSDIIIQRSSELRNETPTGKNKQEREKLGKTLVDRKRKAWSTLLAEVKRIGLSPRPSTKVVAEQSKLATLLALEVLAETTESCQIIPTGLVSSIESYYYRLCSLMPHVRAAASAHHPDVLPSQLQAASGYLDSSLRILQTSHTHLASDLKHFRDIYGSYTRLERLAQQGISVEQYSSPTKMLNTYCANFMLLKDALEELVVSGNQHAQFMKTSDQDDLSTVKQVVYEYLEVTTRLADQLHCHQMVQHDRTPMAAPVSIALKDAHAFWDATSGNLVSLSARTPRLAYLLDPVCRWMETVTSSLEMTVDESTPGKLDLESEQVASSACSDAISGILVSVQNLNGLEAKEVPVAEDEEYMNGGLSTQFTQLRRRSQMLHLQSISGHIHHFSEQLVQLVSHTGRTETAEYLVKTTVPFLEAYVNLARSHIIHSAFWHRALLKFSYIISQTALTLAKEGFCRPTETDESEGADISGLEGTGMGSGEGANNVSDQITGDEQLEGLQDEKEDESAPKDATDDKDDNVFDMDDDFGGTTEDAGGREDDDDSSDKDDEQDEGDLDEELGDVDPLDPSAMDEKFWEEDKKEEDESSAPQEEQSNQNAGQPDSTDMGERSRGAEEADEEDKKSEELEDKKPEDGIDENANAGEQLPDGSSDEPQEDDEPAEDGQRQELPDIDLDNETLDLPDDLQLDTPRDADDGDIDDADAQEEGGGDDLDMGSDNGSVADDDLAEGEKETQAEDQQVGPDEETPQEGPSDDKEPFLHQSGGADAGLGDNAGQDAMDSSTEESAEKKLDAQMRENADLGGVNGEPIQQDSSAQPEAEKESGAADQIGNGESGSGGDNTAAAPAGSAGETSKDMSEKERAEARQLGDQNKEYMRRMEAISEPGNADDPESQRPVGQTDNNHQDLEVEYMREDEEADEEGLQATGAATEDQMSMSQFRPDDAEMLDDFQSLEIDTEQAAIAKAKTHYIPDAETRGDQQKQDRKHATGDDKAGQKLVEDILPNLEDQLQPSTDMEDDQEDPLEGIELQLQHWLAEGRQSLAPDEVWRLYTNLTRELSYSLTESLRLVLEPTLATRLKGDYRTGKRLNMRKIIPYIASDYTKDKIWLRRTRPSQREYQVLLALDDSRSMSDSRAVHLAYQTLALMSQSLTKLEVGEISVCKFGENTDFIHNFEDGPVSDAIGTKIVESFTFDQRSTDIRKLLEKSLQRLQTARDRRGGNSVDLWQLEIIVSDGMCQDLEEIRALLRKAREQKIMVVFVVLDSLHQSQTDSIKSLHESSILSMKSVSYQKSKSGSLELKMERYMDTFPFEYYVVLQDVDALPEILAETLRQFFDKVRGDDT